MLGVSKVVLNLQVSVGEDSMTVKIIGKEYCGHKIVQGFSTMFEIKALGKGTVNKELRGMYTSAVAAMSAIDKVKSEQDSRSTVVEKDNGAKQTG